MPEIVSIGECMIELFSDEPMGSAETFHRAYAGDTNNVLHMASKLGISCGYITRSAEDHFGDYLLNAWRDNGIDTSAVKRVEGFTAVHFISLLPGATGSSSTTAREARQAPRRPTTWTRPTLGRPACCTRAA